MLRLSASIALLSLLALGCGSPVPAFTKTALSPALPTQQGRCGSGPNRESPLVTEWSGSEKANLEARLGQGAVVVSYTGCTLKMLPSCRVAGSYGWRRTTTSTDMLEIHDLDELYAKLPLGAVSLEGELRQSGRLAVQTTVAGQMQLTAFQPADVARDDACLGATHVVSALSLGAFKLRSGGVLAVSGSAEIASLGSSSGSTQRSESILREAGAPARCEDSSEAAPHRECASPLQLFLRELPTNVVDRGPPGTVKVRFLPVRPNEDWRVVVGDRPLCKAPCEKWVDPGMPYSLKYDPGFWQRNQYVELPDLRPFAELERIEVRVVPRNTAEFALGIVATSLGGAAVATGTALTAAGCGSGGGLCKAGLITLPAGLLVAGPGVFLIVDSAGEIQVNRAGEMPESSLRAAKASR